MENGGEVCLAEEVERRRRSGMTAEEIAREMGLQLPWVEETLAASQEADPDTDPPGRDRG